MPQLKDIEQFKNSLSQLGHEPEILKQWGEKYIDEPVPEQKVSEDLAALMEDSTSAIMEPVEELSPDDVLDSPETDDFTSFLKDMNLEEPSTDDLLKGLDEEAVEAPEPREGQSGEQFAFSEEGDTFSSPDSLLAGFQDDIAAAADEADAEKPGSDNIDFSDMGSFAAVAEEAHGEETAGAGKITDDEYGIGDFDIASFSGAEETPAENVEPAPAEDFSALDALEELGDIDLGGEASHLDKPAEDDFGFGDMAGFNAPSSAETPEPFGEAETGSSLGASEGEPGGDFSHEALDALGDLSDIGGETGAPSETPSESLPLDAFDAFDFGGTSQPLPDLGQGDFESLGGESDLDNQIAALESPLPEVENFSLENAWGNDFSIPGYELKTVKEPEKKGKPLPFEGPREPQRETASAEQERAVDLTEAQVDAMQDSLLSFPLNLRLAIEDILANEKGTSAQQSSLVWMLVEGTTARDAAKLAGKILKRYIEIPAGFEKRTGAALEAEKATFAYIFKHSIWPVLQVVLLVVVGLAIVIFLGYNFVYRPIHANSLYAEGYRQIEADKFPESDEYFAKADGVWIQKNWYYRYARAYVNKKQFPRARHIFELLLWRWPKETKAALEYARMESEILLSFEAAEKVLKRFILERDYFNQEALILMADNYLAWADYEEQKYEGASPELLASLYEKARLQLATIMQNHGRTDAYLERMLKYFVRVERSTGIDKLREIVPIAEYFLKNERSGFAAGTLAELGEYLMDRDTSDRVQEILVRATRKEPAVPEAHAAIARWFRLAKIGDKEKAALENAEAMFRRADEESTLNTKRVRSYLNVLIRLAEVLMEGKESLDAEPVLATCIQRYERAITERRFKRTPEFGKAYALLGDIYFFKRRDYQGALARYRIAEANGYRTPDTDYQSGYIYYIDPSSDGEKALASFYRAGLDREQSPYLVYAIANTLYRRSDWFAAQGYYAMLAQRLQFELDTLSLPSPQTRPSHQELVELLMQTRNNLGASLYNIGERLGDGRRRAEAMLEFTESARLFDALTRDQKSMLRPETKNLSFLNLDFILHPKRGIDIGIYADIRPNMKFPRD